MKEQLEKITIIGAGALGSVYGSILYEMCPESMCFIAGGGRYDRLQRHGVVVNDKRYGIPTPVNQQLYDELKRIDVLMAG